jgi:1-acyl-sn-glycerol-3-phosphate acyltransferase
MGLVYQIGYWASRLLANTCFNYRVIGRERIPQHGGLVLAMNHESFMDPPLAGISSEREVYYFARKSLLDWPVLGGLFPKMRVIPFDQTKTDLSALKTAVRVVEAGNGVVMFPEGTRTRDGRMGPAQPGVGFVVARTGAPVLPMRIFGAYRAFPPETRAVRFEDVTVVVGDIMHFSSEEVRAAGKDAYQWVSDRVMERIRALELPEIPVA